MIFECENVTLGYENKIVISNLSFTIDKGDYVCIVGENGTGKSTLIKLCTGQLLPDDGRVTWQSKTSIGYLDQYAEIHLKLDMKSFLKTKSPCVALCCFRPSATLRCFRYRHRRRRLQESLPQSWRRSFRAFQKKNIRTSR